MIAEFTARGKRRFRVPTKLAGPEWVITGKTSEVDNRVQTELLVSYGYLEGNSGHKGAGLRDVSLRIGNNVVILDTLNQNALLHLLLEAVK